MSGLGASVGGVAASVLVLLAVAGGLWLLDLLPDGLQLALLVMAFVAVVTYAVVA